MTTVCASSFPSPMGTWQSRVFSSSVISQEGVLFQAFILEQQLTPTMYQAIC